MRRDVVARSPGALDFESRLHTEKDPMIPQIA